MLISASRSVGEHRLWIDTIDLAYYTVADGDGRTAAAREAGRDVGGNPRSAAGLGADRFALRRLARERPPDCDFARHAVVSIALENVGRHFGILNRHGTITIGRTRRPAEAGQ
jgi:hypothetical protein